MPEIPTIAKVYIAGVISLGTVLLAECMRFGWQSQDSTRWVAYVSLACIVSAWKLRLPKMHGTISVNFLFILIGIAELSLQETLILGALATLVQCLWKSRRRTVVQVLFNISAVVVSITACFGLTNIWVERPLKPAYLALAASLYFAANTASVSMVLALLEKKRFRDVWTNCHLWTFPYYVAGAAVAALITTTSRSVGWRPALLSLLPMYLAYTYYKVYLQQHASQASI